MTAEAWTVLLVGIGLAGLIFRMDAHVRARGERLARVEGILAGVLNAINQRD